MADNTIKIGGELESMATGKIVAAASAIKDKSRNKTQEAINGDVEQAIVEQSAQFEALSEETSAAVASASESARQAEQYLADLQEAITGLPDGQAVSAQVAINEADIARLKSKTDSINKQSTESEEDAIIYETDEGVQVGKIDANGADFANLKRGGQQVARMTDLPTKDSSITENPSTTNVPTTKAVKDYVDAHSGGDYPIETETTQSEDEEQVWGNDAETQEYAKVGSYGMKAKAYLDMQGNSVIPVKDTSIGETPSQTNIPTSKAVADYVTNSYPFSKIIGGDAKEIGLEDDDGNVILIINDHGICCKKYMDINGNDVTTDWSDKTIMIIGDSVSSAGRSTSNDTSIAGLIHTKTGATVINHSKGGIGAIAMVDGSNYNPDSQYDPDDYGVQYLPPLSAEEVANCDYIIAIGFFNECNLYLAREPYNYGNVTDIYDPNGTNSVCAKLNHVLDRIYECLSSANNSKCKIAFATPYKCGCYPYGTGNGYNTYLRLAEMCIKPFAAYNGISCFDFMSELGMNKYNWGILTEHETIYNPNYIPYNSEVEGNSPFPTTEDLPTTDVANNSYATVGTTDRWSVYKYVSGTWQSMQFGCTPTSQGTISQGGSLVGAFKWFADQLHPSLECRHLMADFIIKQLIL